MPTRLPDLDPVVRRHLVAGPYNRAWELLELAGGTPDQDDELVHAAHASRPPGCIGIVAGAARTWRMVVQRRLPCASRAEPARWHVARCLAILDEHAATPDAGGAEDWDRAAGCEALSGAEFPAGNPEAAASWKRLGRELCAAIADPEDRRAIEDDLDSIPV